MPGMDSPDLAPLRAFRDALYACFGRRADALFEVADALLAVAPVPALPSIRTGCHGPAARVGCVCLHKRLRKDGQESIACRRIGDKFVEEPLNLFP